MAGDPFSTDLLQDRASIVAPRLLGAYLVVGERSGRIVEVEAYEGSNDGASHAAGGPTPRNELMFSDAGYLYVYKIYGIHWCANIVTGDHSKPGAVLIRAVEPVDGLEAMWNDRPKAKQVEDLGSGPGKLCAALAISGDDNGAKATRSPGPDPEFDRSRVQVRTGSKPERISTGPRIGISKAIDLQWRFGESGSTFMSRPRL